MPEKTAQKAGRIIEIKGVVIDAVFHEGLPEIYNALRIDIPAREGQEARGLIAEVQQHLGDDRVRAVVVHIDSPGGGVAASQERVRLLHSQALVALEPFGARAMPLRALAAWLLAAAAGQVGSALLLAAVIAFVLRRRRVLRG